MLGQGPMLQEDATPVASAPQGPLSEEQARQTLAAAFEQAGGISAFIKEYMEAVAPELANEVRQQYLDAYRVTEMEYLRRSYHFGEQPTPGLDYDDRITTRLNLNKQELQEWLDSPDFNELPHKKLGKRIVVTERGLRQFLGDLPKLS